MSCECTRIISIYNSAAQPSTQERERNEWRGKILKNKYLPFHRGHSEIERKGDTTCATLLTSADHYCSFAHNIHTIQIVRRKMRESDVLFRMYYLLNFYLRLHWGEVNRKYVFVWRKLATWIRRQHWNVFWIATKTMFHLFLFRAEFAVSALIPTVWVWWHYADNVEFLQINANALEFERCKQTIALHDPPSSN